MIAAVEVDEALLALKIGFLVLLYLFIWVIVRSATRDLRAAPQESIVLSAAEASELRARAAAVAPQAVAPAAPLVRLRVLAGPVLPQGTTAELVGTTTVGRAADAGIRLDDDFVSSRHAALTVTPDGLWVEDSGSTNGTFVNGARVSTQRLLQPGDVLRVGRTDFEVVA